MILGLQSPTSGIRYVHKFEYFFDISPKASSVVHFFIFLLKFRFLTWQLIMWVLIDASLYFADWTSPFNFKNGWSLWAVGGLSVASFVAFVIKAFISGLHAGYADNEVWFNFMCVCARALKKILHVLFNSYIS